MLRKLDGKNLAPTVRSQNGASHEAIFLTRLVPRTSRWIAVFVCAASRDKNRDVALGWGKCVRGVDVHFIPGDHASVLKERSQGCSERIESVANVVFRTSLNTISSGMLE